MAEYVTRYGKIQKSQFHWIFWAGIVVNCFFLLSIFSIFIHQGYIRNIARIAKRWPSNIASVVNVSSCFYLKMSLLLPSLLLLLLLSLLIPSLLLLSLFIMSLLLLSLLGESLVVQSLLLQSILLPSLFYHHY